VGFNGVRKAYAIQAGREVRVIVDANRLDDKASVKLARRYSQKDRAGDDLPRRGEITVLRESGPWSTPDKMLTQDRLPSGTWSAGRPRGPGLLAAQVGGRAECPLLPGQRREHRQRFGLNPQLLTRSCATGAHLITMGDHIYRRKEILPVLERSERICRPANLPPESIGREVAIYRRRRRSGRGGDLPAGPGCT